MKTWSLPSSSTEIPFSFGRADRVAGVTHKCGYPLETNLKTRVTYFNRPGPGVVDGLETLAHIFHPDLYRKAPPLSSVLKLVSPPAGASSVENWTPRFEPLLAGVS